MPIATSDGATVTMSLHDFRQVERQLDELRTKLQAADAQAAPRPTDQHAADALRALRGALDVVSFAVANLPPEAVVGWPFESLEVIAEQLDILYPTDPDTQTLAITLRQFAGECAQVAEFRGTRADIASAVVAATAPTAADTTENGDSP